MYILGIDTTTSIMTIALSEDESILIERSVDCGQFHVVKIITEIDKVFKKTKVDLSQIDLIGVDIGPGMYSGTRIGLALAKTLSQINLIDIIGITSVYALAFQASKKLNQLKNKLQSKGEKIKRQKICISSLINANRGEAYSSFFASRKGYLEKIIKDELLTIDDLIQKIFELINIYKKVILCGNALIDYPQINNIFEKEKRVMLLKNIILPRASSINYLAFYKYKEGKVDDYKKLIPKYVRPFIPFGR
jgi:tRNA threonylcarbamoyladenosine biosynthesis protein TsaB